MQLFDKCLVLGRKDGLYRKSKSESEKVVAGKKKKGGERGYKDKKQI
jgi:hypothetical protein